jgi:Ca-activated chloride channel family protein
VDECVAPSGSTDSIRQVRTFPLWWRVGIGWAAWAASGLGAGAQSSQLQDRRAFRSGIEVTSITATVRDADGKLVTGLEQDAFEVFEDGEPQTITQFTRDRVPVGLGVLLDISDSMFGHRIEDARAAIDRFLFELLDPGDEFFLLAFNHQPHLMTGWTSAPDQVRHALEGLRPSGGTAAYDAVVAALPTLARRTRERAALVLVSDGADTASNASLREVRSALMRSDAFVYAIAIDSPEPQPINTRVNVTTLREVTDDSGGRTEVVHNRTELIDATARIADELNHQYVLGYTSPRGADGKYHSIRVRVRGTGYKVRARNGYVADPTNGRSSK